MATKEESKVWSALTLGIVLVVTGALVWLYARANTGGGVAPRPAMFEGGAATLDEALVRAGEDGLVFAFATADWCPPCQHYKRTTLVDPEIEAWVREHATPVYVDVTENGRDAGALGVQSVPQTTMLRGDGTVVMKVVGAVGVEELMEAFKGLEQGGP